MTQLRQRESELTAEDIRVKVVSFDGDIMADAYRSQTNLEWPLLRDVDRSLYQAYGFTRGSWWDIYGPQSIWKYLKLIFSGRRPGKPGKDWRQLGGDVLIDSAGIVRLHFVSENPHDRPSVDEILEVAKSQ